MGQIAIQAEHLGWKAGCLSPRTARWLSHATTAISNIANTALYWNDLNNAWLQMEFVDKRLGLIDTSLLNKGLFITTGLFYYSFRFIFSHQELGKKTTKLLMREQQEVTLLDNQVSSSELELSQIKLKEQEGALISLEPEGPQQRELQERKIERPHPRKNQGVYLNNCTRVMAVIFRVAVLFFALVSLLYSKTEKSGIAF